MPTKEQSSDSITTKTATLMPHQIFHGTTWHSRLLPSVHKFAYPYRYWGVNISALAAGQALPEVNAAVDKSKFFKKLPFNKMLAKALPLFSAQHKALQQFYPDDYLQQLEQKDLGSTDDTTNESRVNTINDDVNPVQALQQRLNQAFIHHTDSAPTGDMIGMMVCRNAGVYFSPVNFYLGFDKQRVPTHLLAEVSNTPWDKRHYYGFLLDGTDTEFCHDKDFHVSPFNPIDQLYRWQVKVTKHADDCLQVRIAINISDARGAVLKTGIKMTGVPMSADTVRDSLRKNPLMNITSLTRIYWHALKLYAIKKVPYINYGEKLVHSQQDDSKSPS